MQLTWSIPHKRLSMLIYGGCGPMLAPQVMVTQTRHTTTYN